MKKASISSCRLRRSTADPAAAPRQGWHVLSGAVPASALILATLSPQASGAQTGGTMDPVTFVADLQRVSAEVSGGAAGQVPVVTLPSAWIVEAGDQRIDVPAQSFRRALENARRNPSTWPAQRSRILAQLGAMQDEARAFAARSSVRAGSSPADSRSRAFRTRRESSAKACRSWRSRRSPIHSTEPRGLAVLTTDVGDGVAW